MAPFPGHLADPAPPAEDYFKSGLEQENGNEQVSRPLSSKHRLDDEDDKDNEDDEKESRYSVPKKRDSKNASQASPSNLDLSDGSDADSVADFEDSQGEGYEENESDAIIDEVKQELQELREHVIDLASLMNGTAPEVGDAPATDLTHLDDEKFKVRKQTTFYFSLPMGLQNMARRLFISVGDKTSKDPETSEINDFLYCKTTIIKQSGCIGPRSILH